MERPANVLAMILLAAPFFSGTAYAKCHAAVESVRFWEEEAGGVQKAHLKVRVGSDRPGASVKVEAGARFHFERSDGWRSSIQSRGTVIVSTLGEAVESLVLHAAVSACSRDKPCAIKEVEIARVVCHD